MLLLYEGEFLNVDTSEFVVSASGGVILQKGSNSFGGGFVCPLYTANPGRSHESLVV